MDLKKASLLLFSLQSTIRAFESSMNSGISFSLNAKQKKLFAAIKKRDAIAATQLIEDCVEPNFACPQRRGHVTMTPLMLACHVGLPAVVGKLINAGALVDVTVESFGCTALYTPKTWKRMRSTGNPTEQNADSS